MARPRLPRRRSRATAHLVHAFASPAAIEASGPLTLSRGKGVFVWDTAGKKYLDGVSSLWNVNVGHGRAEIARVIAEQTRRLSFAPTLLGFSSEPAQRLAERIASMAPRGLDHVLFTSGGSEANESMIRLVRLYWRLRGRPDKYRVVALTGAYHGSSTGAASLTGLPTFHQHYGPLMPGVFRIARAHCYRCELGLTHPSCALACADELEKLVEREGADRIGAFVAEPVQGVGGVIVPPPGYFERIRAICDRHEILFVADEVINGFGRLGLRFGVERWKVIPDLLIFAKGVTSGYLPLGGVVLRDAIFRTLVDAGSDFVLHHGFTYSGHPVVCAAGLENLDILEREKLIPHVRRIAPYFSKRLRSLERHAIVGNVRSAGLMGAVELVRDRATKEPFPAEMGLPRRIRNLCLDQGLIVRATADLLVLCPPLIVTRDQIDFIVETLDAAIARVQEGLGETLNRGGAEPKAPPAGRRSRSSPRRR